MYIVIELQKNKDGTVGNIVNSYESLNEAESKYHSILATAAVSDVERHSAAVLEDTCRCILHKSYDHIGE